MKIIICLDERGGMTFLGKRQSRDEAVFRDIIKSADGARIYVSEYSAPLFNENEVLSVKEPQKAARSGDFCFIENGDITPFLKEAEALIIYNWNRHYPADKKFDISLEKYGLRLTETKEFSGRSHEKITKEIYTK